MVAKIRAVCQFIIRKKFETFKLEKLIYAERRSVVGSLVIHFHGAVLFFTKTFEKTRINLLRARNSETYDSCGHFRSDFRCISD